MRFYVISGSEIHSLWCSIYELWVALAFIYILYQVSKLIFNIFFFSLMNDQKEADSLMLTVVAPSNVVLSNLYGTNPCLK